MADELDGFFTPVTDRSFRENQPREGRVTATKPARLRGGDSPTAAPNQQQPSQLLYTIKGRDTLAGIARRNRTDAATLFELNREVIGPDANNLPKGAELRIPLQ